MILGFIGTGAITSAIVTGLSSDGGPRPAIRLSPRNAAVASDLSGRFPNVSMCASNQDVLDACDTVILAVRPQVAAGILSSLRFSRDHAVVSLIANLPVSRVAELVSPAASIARAVPLPSCAQRRSPIPVYPPGGPAAEIFGPLGHVVCAASEDHLGAFGAATSTMAAYFAFIGEIAAWLVEQGIPEQQAREYMARVFAGLAGAGLEDSSRTYEELADAHATPGGLNEQLLRELKERGVFRILSEALNGVRRRTFAEPG